MEIVERNVHLKLQEMCDCYMETDFRKQMQGMSCAATGELEENSLKYLSLAIMYTITVKAGKLTLEKKGELVTAHVKDGDEELHLPPPSREQFDKITEIMRAILHIEEDKGEMVLALGLRSGDLELGVKIKRKPDKEKLKIKFPAL